MARTAARRRADHPRSASSRSYTSSEELGALVSTYQSAKRWRKKMSPARHARLLEVLQAIAGGVWDRWRFTDSRDDFVQDCLYLFLHAALGKIDPERNCHAYLTTTAKNHGLAKQRQRVRQLDAELRHRAAVVDEGRHLGLHHFPEMD